MTRAEQLEELQQKADWEGGWLEYICGYGADIDTLDAIDPTGALSGIASDLQEREAALQTRLDQLCGELGVDSL